MKKITSVILTVALLLTVGIGTHTVSNAASIKKYKGVVSKALSSHKKYQSYNDYYELFKGNSFLYDFDNNGIKELVMLYGGSKNNSPSYFLSVYTIKKGKAKAIIKNRCIQQDAGTPKQCVGVAKKKGKTYLFLGKGNSLGMGNYFNLTFYKIKGSGISKKYTGSGKYTFRFTNSNKTKVTTKTKINGKKVKNSKFNKWQKSFSFKYVKKTKVTFMEKAKRYEYVPASSCMSIKSLYNKVS